MLSCVFLFLCFSLKLECDKLASEKSEMQRHYIMVSKACMFQICFQTYRYADHMEAVSAANKCQMCEIKTEEMSQLCNSFNSSYVRFMFVFINELDWMLFSGFVWSLWASHWSVVWWAVSVHRSIDVLLTDRCECVSEIWVICCFSSEQS